MGVIRTKEEEYFIEPMRNLENFSHLVYKRSSLISVNGDSKQSEPCGATKGNSDSSLHKAAIQFGIPTDSLFVESRNTSWPLPFLPVMTSSSHHTSYISA